MLPFGLCDVLVVTTNENLATVNDVVKESTRFVVGEEFLLSDHILWLHFVEFAQKGADVMLSTIHFLCQHCSHCILLGGIRINDEQFIRIGISAGDKCRGWC